MLIIDNFFNLKPPTEDFKRLRGELWMDLFRSVLNFCELPLVSLVRHMQITRIKSLHMDTVQAISQGGHVFMKIKSAVARIYVNTGEIICDGNDTNSDCGWFCAQNPLCSNIFFSAKILLPPYPARSQNFFNRLFWFVMAVRKY